MLAKRSNPEAFFLDCFVTSYPAIAACCIYSCFLLYVTALFLMSLYYSRISSAILIAILSRISKNLSFKS